MKTRNMPAARSATVSLSDASGVSTTRTTDQAVVWRGLAATDVARTGASVAIGRLLRFRFMDCHGNRPQPVFHKSLEVGFLSVGRGDRAFQAEVPLLPLGGNDGSIQGFSPR